MKTNIIVKEVYDDFEGDRLSGLWQRKKFEQGAVKIQSKIVRKGKRAVKVTLRSGDKFEDNKGKTKNSERDELREEEYLWAREGDAYEYSYSMFLPKNFPIVHTRLVLSQWKQHDENENSTTGDRPLIALRYRDGVFCISLQTGEEKKTLFRTDKEIRGKWIDFKFQVKFTRKRNGFLRIWMNRKKVVNYQGATALSKKCNYIYPGRFHFRFGLYRDLMKKSMTAYFDEYRKRKLNI